MRCEITEALEVLENTQTGGEKATAWVRSGGVENVEPVQVQGDHGSIDFIKVRIPAKHGTEPPLGVIERLGGGSKDRRAGFGF